MGKTERPEWLAPALDYAGRWLDFQMRQTETPGMVFAAADHKGLVLERAFGFADLAVGTPTTCQHRFRFASHSKTFTAAGIMLLHEAGRLHLDDSIGCHVDGLEPAVGAATLSQLLSHTAGIARDGQDAGHWQDLRPFPDATEFRAELARPPTLDANFRFKYSNVGYGLLGLAIEAITGEPYRAWMARNVIAASEPVNLSFWFCLRWWMRSHRFWVGVECWREVADGCVVPWSRHRLACLRICLLRSGSSPAWGGCRGCGRRSGLRWNCVR